MANTTEQMRLWRGPTLLTYGFRPLFLGAGLWATIAMIAWISMLTGEMILPTSFDPVSWHAHEFLFGYLGAVAGGFLLTAVPNWTGRLPIVGWPLAGLCSLWILGRFAVATSLYWTPISVAVLDLSFLITLAVLIAREIIAGRNWRNLVVLAMLVTLLMANAVFHWEAAQGTYAAQGYGLRLGLGVGIMMISVIGGRVVPSFTRNWLAKRGARSLPSKTGFFDKVALLCLLIALIVWVIFPDERFLGVLLLFAGVIHAARLARWSGLQTLAEPLVWVLHLGYTFVPLGAIVLGLGILFPEQFPLTAALHLWMAGAIGLMTLAMMTRATLGHTGRELSAGTGTTLIYGCVTASVFARFLAGSLPELADMLYFVAGSAWIMGFGGFTILYGRMLLWQRKHE